jgi:hypothetical protein
MRSAIVDNVDCIVGRVSASSCRIRVLCVGNDCVDDGVLQSNVLVLLTETVEFGQERVFSHIHAYTVSFGLFGAGDCDPTSVDEGEVEFHKLRIFIWQGKGELVLLVRLEGGLEDL